MRMFANCRNCRRAGEKLFLKGSKCSLPSCPFNKRSHAPGETGSKRRFKRVSDYAIQLSEKQKARAIYGISEAQMSNYFTKARKTKSATGEKLISFLESRLDNVVFRAGFTESRDAARQVVAHGKIRLNGKKAKTPSLQVKPSDEIKLPESEKGSGQNKSLVDWIKRVDAKTVLVKRAPGKSDVQEPFNEQLIIEYYSR